MHLLFTESPQPYGAIARVIGRSVEIRSTGGIVYRGVVERIEETPDGEMFILGSPDDPNFQRLVFVLDRSEQINELTEE